MLPTGAAGAQVIDYAIVPQVLQLQSSLNTLAWNQVTMILLVILVTVVVSEWVSAEVRQAVLWFRHTKCLHRIVTESLLRCS